MVIGDQWMGELCEGGTLESLMGVKRLQPTNPASQDRSWPHIVLGRTIGRNRATVKIIASRFLYEIYHFGEILQNLGHSLENEAGKPNTMPFGGMFACVSSWSA